MEKIKKLQVSASIKIPKGKLEEYKQLAAEAVRITRERDTGTLKYDWFLSSDQKECEWREEFKDSEAFLEHMVNTKEIQGKMFREFPIDHVNLYGDPSPEILEAIKGFDVRLYSYSQGLEELIEAI
ncbi:MAG: putative quinol monooxygenase [Promethearchaeota archaeon]|jgi:quinol monooxygenase YgiN